MKTQNISGPVVQVRSGDYVDLLNPSPDTIHFDDIACALSRLCRYTGHTNRFYSVAQHCVLCCESAPPDSKWAALMHDAAEAFIGDVSRPLKALLPEYKIIEKRLESVIFAKFQVVEDEHVKRVDREALATEQRDLMPDTGEVWAPTIGYTSWRNSIVSWNPGTAYSSFCELARQHAPVDIQGIVADARWAAA